jgi:hypothetical protein
MIYATDAGASVIKRIAGADGVSIEDGAGDTLVTIVFSYDVVTGGEKHIVSHAVVCIEEEKPHAAAFIECLVS